MTEDIILPAIVRKRKEYSTTCIDTKQEMILYNLPLKDQDTPSHVLQRNKFRT